MATKETEEINRTQGEGEQVPCSKCNGKTYHEVMLSIDKEGEERGDDFDYYWNSHYQIIQCQGCKTISFRKTSSNSEDFEQINEYEDQIRVYENIYPPRIEGRSGLEDTAYYLPSTVREIYTETLQALNNKSPILTGIGLRALVETVCKEEKAHGNSLEKKIDSLKEKGILTFIGAETLHNIRTMGNDAAHEVKPHSERQLSVAMDVIEHLLADVYILPKKVKTAFKSPDKTLD